MGLASIAEIAKALASVVGSANVLTDEDERAYFSTDLSFEPLELAEAVAQPARVEELQAVVRVAHEQGLVVIPRGGGMSYTHGYTPPARGCVMVDMRGLDEILEINTEEMYVTVECGCTWESLYEACRAEGVRTPFFGPNSGRFATVGGSLSQDAVFYGSSRHGFVSESVIGLDVVTAGGTLVRTGTSALAGRTPFWRHAGPDLTGPFVGDSGALGLKARATLRLVPFPAASGFASFGYDSFPEQIASLAELARECMAAEIYTLDTPFHEQRVAGGFPFLAEHDFSVHFAVDGATQAIVDAELEHLRGIAQRRGVEMDNAIPRGMREDPFAWVEPVMLGPEGEIWLPIHAMIPFGKAVELGERYEDFLETNKAALDAHGVSLTVLTLAGHNAFLWEPAFYWRDELGRFRLEKISPEGRERWADIEPNPEARALVLRLRRELTELVDSLGAVHFQLGRYYRFLDELDPPTRALLRAIKAHVDPDDLVNRGSLGLD